jgi:NAD(P)-dependent dehydrogenase (short-subunit alcohol dehydrogenase family)
LGTPNSELTGRIALVTGASRGIGRATALALGRAGCEVAASARSGADLESLKNELRAAGHRCEIFPSDLSQPGNAEALFSAVMKTFGRIDVLVNNAAIAESAPLHKMDDAHWDRHLFLDLTVPFQLTRACLPGMYERNFGRIVNVASTAGKVGFSYTAAYCAAKHGLLGLTRTTALEGAKRGVTANAVCPGWTETAMLQHAIEVITRKTGRSAEEARAEILRDTKSGKAITPEEVAEVILRLAASPSMNGEAIDIEAAQVKS